MSGLGHYWRLRASNTQNQSITVTVKARYWKLGSDGALSWSSEQTLISAASVSATTGTTASSNIDNSSDKYLGAELTVQVQAGSTTNGTGALTVYIERSTDSGTTWPTQDRGQPVNAYTVTAADATSNIATNMMIR